MLTIPCNSSRYLDCPHTDAHHLMGSCHGKGTSHPLPPRSTLSHPSSPHSQEFAQRSLIAYVRSVFLQPNKRVFDVTKLPVGEYAQSLGLLTAPKLRFLKKVRREVWMCGL